MPCRDRRAWDWKAREEEKKNLIDRNDKLMRVICKIDTYFHNNPQWDNFLITVGGDVADVIFNHRSKDDDRWWEHYKTVYPTFTKQEVARMVRAGILQDI